MWYPYNPTAVSSQQSLSSASAEAMLISYASTPVKYREVSYHLDGRDRYVAESYENRSPSRQAPPVPWGMQKLLQSTEYPFEPQSVMRPRLGPSETRSTKSIVVIQSREVIRQDQLQTRVGVVEAFKSVAPPSAPRPRRLSTPELSDVKDDRPFCHCNSKNTCAGLSRRQTLF